MRQILGHLGLITVGDETAWAVTSPDDRYRYMLGRVWDDYFCGEQRSTRPLWVFCMLNPSTARVDDDATIRKCIGFARRGGAGGLIVVNTMAYSATDPDELVRAYRSGVDVCGEHNITALTLALEPGMRDVLEHRYIAAWGKISPAVKEVAQVGVTYFLRSAPDCFGINLDGSPRHPLMLAYATPIVRVSSFGDDALAAGGDDLVELGDEEQTPESFAAKLINLLEIAKLEATSLSARPVTTVAEYDKLTKGYKK